MDQLNDRVLAEGKYLAGGTEIHQQIQLQQRTLSVVVRSYLEEGELYLETCQVESEGAVYSDSFWSLLILVGLLGLCGHVLRRYRQRRQIEGLILLALAIGVSLPLMGDSLLAGHDLNFHLNRIDGLATALCTGQFPARINPNFLYGAGYLTPIMYPELFLYPSGLMCVLGASTMLAYKALCLGINLATAWVGYHSMRNFLSERAALIFAALYLLNPYRLSNLYIRCAIGEVLAMIFLPLAMVGLWNLLQGNPKTGFWQAIAGITGVYQSHVISTLLLIFFGGLYVLGCLVAERQIWKQKERWIALIGAAVAVIALNLWTILPFMRYLGWDLGTSHDKPALSKTALAPYKIFADSFQELSVTYSIGLVTLLGMAIYLFYRLAQKKKAGREDVCLGFGLFAIFLSSQLFPWDSLQAVEWINFLAGTLQFAWRNLGIAALMGTAVTATAMEWLIADGKRGIAGGMALLCLMSGFGFLSEYVGKTSVAMASKSSRWDLSYLDLGHYVLWEDDSQAVSDRSKQGVVYASGDAQVTWHQKSGVNVTFAFENPDPSEEILFEVPLYFYDLHRAFLEDGTELELTTGYNHMLCVKVPAGISQGEVAVRLDEPLSFRAAEGISLLALASLIGLRKRRIRRARLET